MSKCANGLLIPKVETSYKAPPTKFKGHPSEKVTFSLHWWPYKMGITVFKLWHNKLAIACSLLMSK